MRRLFLLASLPFIMISCSSPGTPGSIPNGTMNSSSHSEQAAASDTTSLTYISLGFADSFPWSLMQGPDGAVWFADWRDALTGSGAENNFVGRITSTGAVTEFDTGGVSSTPILGADGQNGNLWFANSEQPATAANQSFVQVTTAGQFTAYPLPSTTWQRLRSSAAAPDGNIWYAALRTSSIFRVTPLGDITRFPLPPTSADVARPTDITIGSDGALWFTEWTGNAIGRITTDGTLTNVYMLPTAEAAPRFIAAGADGALWFTENGSLNAFGDSFTPPQIVRMTTSGQMTTYALPNPSAYPDSIRPATGGFVFADLDNAVGFIDYSGSVVEYPIARAEGALFGDTQFAVQGADGAFYFADDDMHRVGKITLGKKGLIFPQAFTINGIGSTQLVGVAVLGDRGPFSASTDNASCATVAPIQGFAMNFMVTAVGQGSCTLSIKGKGKAMSAAITVTAGASTQSLRRSIARRPSLAL